jgi:hypothetical protein
MEFLKEQKIELRPGQQWCARGGERPIVVWGNYSTYVLFWREWDRELKGVKW